MDWDNVKEGLIYGALALGLVYTVSFMATIGVIHALKLAGVV